MPLNEDNEFTIDITNSSIPFSTFNANNQTDNDKNKSNNSDIISIVIIGGIAVISCSILSGLVYLYYQNHILPQASDSSVETTATNPLGDDKINVSIGGDEENRNSDYSDFYE